jgi:transcriptional regulator with GAF, ATPase, and Fis domain
MADHRVGTGGRGQPSSSDTGTAVGDVLAESLGALARDLEQNDDSETMLAAMVAAAVAMVPGAEEGSISVVAARRRITSEAPTSDLPVRVDAIQEEVQQGPCLDAVYEQQTVRVTNLATEARWPLFARRASQTGAASMLSLQLFVEGDNLGALNLFARSPGAFTDESEQVGLLVAAHAAIAYAGVRKETQLAQAMINRDLIGQAKGILIERYKISGDRAFLVLTRVSQNSNRKLHDVAQELVHHGTISTAEQCPRTARDQPTAGQAI